MHADHALATNKHVRANPPAGCRDHISRIRDQSLGGEEGRTDSGGGAGVWIRERDESASMSARIVAIACKENES